MNALQPQPAQAPSEPQTAQVLHTLLTNSESLFNVAREYELEMHVQSLTRQVLADKAKIGIDRVDDFLNRKKPYVSLSTFLKIAKALGKEPLQPPAPPKEQEAPDELGGYTIKSAKQYIGEYLCIRPLFGNPKHLNAYLMDLVWNEKEHCLAFEERRRFDKRHAQRGKVYIPTGQPYISLLTADAGEVRHIILARNREGIMRGLVQTLFNRGGELYTPVCAPIVLRKTNGEVIEDADLGQIDSKKAKYKTYRELLNEVLENDFARLVS
jgi:hypothetical protein